MAKPITKWVPEYGTNVIGEYLSKEDAEKALWRERLRRETPLNVTNNQGGTNMSTLIGKRVHFGNMSNDKSGTVCAESAGAGNTFTFGVGGLVPGGHELTVVYDDLTISEYPESMVDGFQHRWLDEPTTGLEDCTDLLKQAKTQQALRYKEQKRLTTERCKADDRRRTFVESKRPTWAKAVIVAELKEDDSDMMTDYFASHTTRTLVLAWSKHTRDLFPEMRKAAANAPETAYLVADGIEYREKYSMGAGYYLGGPHSHYSGWIVSKQPLLAGGENWPAPGVDPEDYRVPER